MKTGTYLCGWCITETHERCRGQFTDILSNILYSCRCEKCDLL